MTMTPIDPEPSTPNADWIADWAEDESGVFRYYCEPEQVGVKVIGFQNFDGSERPRTVYLRGVGELTAGESRALALALLDAAERV